MLVAADGADHALEVGILPGNGRLVFAIEVLDHGEQVGAADHILGKCKTITRSVSPPDVVS